jgi:hypothetical protein
VLVKNPLGCSYDERIDSATCQSQNLSLANCYFACHSTCHTGYRGLSRWSLILKELTLDSILKTDRRQERGAKLPRGGFLAPGAGRLEKYSSDTLNPPGRQSRGHPPEREVSHISVDRPEVGAIEKIHKVEAQLEITPFAELGDVRVLGHFVRFTDGDLANPGAFHWTKPLSLSPERPQYAGKIVILVDESSMSQAE